MKYIIDIPKTVGMLEAVGSVHYTYFDGIQCKTIILKSDEIEELNSDYINEHYGSLQDDAYNRGYEDGAKSVENWNNEEKKLRLDEAFDRGLTVAWEAARKIADMWTRIDNDELLAIFGITERIGYSTIIALFGKQTASEAFEKLKAYEEKQNDKIEVGDEVLWFMKGDDEGCDDIMDVCAPSVVTMVPNKECDDYTIIESSGAMTVISKEQIYKKTGRHFDIASILEDMRNE